MIEETLAFDCDGLKLEARFAYAEESVAIKAAVLICPPHPFLGGDMENNVVTALAYALSAGGMAVMRFNYRGIGASQTARDLNADQALFWRDSACPAYEAEIHRDCRAAWHTLAREAGAVPLHLVGYSFGCLPALALAHSETVARLLLISPPLAKWPLDASRANRAAARALFYAPGDFACPGALVEKLFADLAQPKQLRAFDDADHFFVGHERELGAAAGRYLDAP